MTPSHKSHRKSRIKLISNGVRCRKRLTNSLFFHRCDLRSSWFGIDECLYSCAIRVATINQICLRRFTLNKVSICSYILHLSLVCTSYVGFFFSLFVFVNLVSCESRDDYMLWLNLYLFLCLEACKTIIYRTCDFVHVNVGCGVHNRNEYFHEIEIFLFHFHKSNDRTHLLTHEIVHRKRKYTSRKLCDKPTIPRAKWNTIGCLSSNERMLVAETRLFCFPLFFFLSSFAAPHIGPDGAMRAFAETPTDCCVGCIEESFLIEWPSMEDRTLPNTSDSNGTKQIDFNCLPFTVVTAGFRLFGCRCRRCQLWIGIDLSILLSVDFVLLSSATTTVQLHFFST